MSCCHADFALTDSSDRAFTIGMPTFTFGAGCLAEAGEQALEHGLKRVALFTDKTAARLGPRRHGKRIAASRRASSSWFTTRSRSSPRPHRSRPRRASRRRESSTATYRSAAAR